MVNREYTNERALPGGTRTTGYLPAVAPKQSATYQPARETMDKPIVMTGANACPECKGFNLSMQTNPVHDPVRHYECHDCGYSWDVSPKRGIVLTSEERTALEAVVSLLKFMYPAHTDPYQITVPPLEQLLARSGGEEEK